MCGILGTNFDISDARFAQALQTIAHRGPDDSGVYSDPFLRLGHHRLSIQDLSANGHQPMSVLDGQVWIVFNGEIYNHREIRERLDPNINYQSLSDTETILYAYLKYGHDVVKMLNGIFTFAIYDLRSHEIFVARDPFGVKPLYYFLENGKLAFASELKALLELPGIERTPDLEALANYLHFLWSPGEKTPLKHVHKLLPGHYFTFNLRDAQESVATPRFTKYYEIPFDGFSSPKSELQLIDELDERFYTAVNRQLLSDVPVGFFLSGGLDSSLIAAMGRKISNASFNCYTIDLGSEAGNHDFVDDLAYAKMVARHLDVNLVHVPGVSDILTDFDAMIWHLDEPQADPAPLHVWNICRLARQNNDVVLLGGTAGDDLFSGYRRHQALHSEFVMRLFPAPAGWLARKISSALPANVPMFRRLQKLSRGLGNSPVQRMAGYYSWLEMDRIRKLFRPELAQQLQDYQASSELTSALKYIPNEHRTLNQMLFWDLKYFLTDHNLNYTDKMSMAAGVEVRVPFLDQELVQFSCELPVDLKMKGNVTKYLLKKVAERYLPKEVIYRPKTGFGAPVRQWVNQGKFDNQIELLKRRTKIFEPVAIDQLVRDCQRGKLDGHYSVWSAVAIDPGCINFRPTIEQCTSRPTLNSNGHPKSTSR